MLIHTSMFSYVYPPPRLRESVWGAFISGSWYLVPGTWYLVWCLGVWSRASIQYTVYNIQYQLLRYLLGGGN